MGVQAARVVFPDADRAEIAAAIAEILGTGMLTLGPIRANSRRLSPRPTAGIRGLPIPTRSRCPAGRRRWRSHCAAPGSAGRDVIVPANTFYATGAAALAAGGRLVFADIDPATFALSPATLAAALTPDTAAVVLVHIGGLITPDVDELRGICEERGIALVEDAAHAHGATWAGRFAGSFGTSAAFSFYPTKVVTCGEGGMILTASAELADEARVYRDQGKGSFGANHHVRHGYAWRMSELHAVTGVVHLRRLAAAVDRRRQVAARYGAALAGLPGLDPLPEPPGCRSNFYKYIAVLPAGVDRARFKQEVADGTRSGWPGRSTTRRCTGSRCSSRSPARPCRSRRTSAPGTCACRSTPTWPTTRSTRSSQRCPRSTGS